MVGNQLFLIQLPKGDVSLRVGTIQGDSKGKTVKVLWEGVDSPETVQMGTGFRKALQDSLTYSIFVQPESVTKMLRTNPTELFYRALKEFDYKPKSFEDIAQLLEGLTIERVVLADAWKVSLEKLVEKEDVSVVGGKKLSVKAQLRRSKKSTETLPQESDNQETETVLKEPQSAVTQVTPESSIETAEQEVSKSKQQQTISSEVLSVDELLLKLATQELRGVENVVLSGSTTPLTQSLIDALQGLELNTEAIDFLALNPLAVSLEIQDVNQVVLSSVASMNNALSMVLIAPLFLCKKANSLVVPEDLENWPKSKPAAATLGTMNIEFSRMDKEAQASHAARVLGFFEALLGSSNTHLELQDVIWILEVSISQDNKQSEKLTTRVIDLLTSELKKKDNSPAFAALATPIVSRLLSKTVFLATGGRTGLVAALGHIDEDAIASAEWWTGFDWEALNRVSTGPLAPLLASEQLTSLVRKPVVDGYLSQVTGRKMLAEVIGASSLATDLISPDLMATLFDRAAKQDKTLQTWLSQLRQQARLDSITAENAQLNLDLVRLSNAANSHSEIIRNFEMEISQLRSKIDEIKGQSSGITEREKQQLQIDALRTIAQLAASVEQVIPDEYVGAVLEKLENLLRRHGIEPTSLRGQPASFDPIFHSCPGKRPANGDPVIVGRSGYKWIDKGHEVILLQALVASA
jgi:hypothetical protein